MPLPSLTALMNPTASPGSLPIPPELVHSMLQAQPAYVVNRERAATVLDAGFRTADTYAKAKPYLFVGGIIGMVVSSVALTKRRARGAETWALWTAAFLASATTAWVTRPTLGGDKAPAGATPAQIGAYGVVSVIDARRAKLKARDPNFADKVFARFDALPVVKSALDQNPLLKAVAS